MAFVRRVIKRLTYLLTYYRGFPRVSSGVKVGGNAWEHGPQARHFCNLAFPGLKERFSAGTHVHEPEI